jgi:chromosomal replication initiation ATPase DnaA
MTRREFEAGKAHAVIAEVAEAEGFDLELFRCRSKRSDLVEARWKAAAAAFARTEASVSEIARIMYKHPSTVLYGLRRLGVAA